MIRAGSLGTLIAADLLERGARPAGVVLIAPVRDSTIVRRAATARRGAFLGMLADITMRSPGAPDLVDVLSTSSLPILVMLPETDVYLSRREARAISAACTGRELTVIEVPGDHQTIILASWGLEMTDSFAGRQTGRLRDAEAAFLARLRATVEK